MTSDQLQVEKTDQPQVEGDANFQGEEAFPPVDIDDDKDDDDYQEEPVNEEVDNDDFREEEEEEEEEEIHEDDEEDEEQHTDIKEEEDESKIHSDVEVKPAQADPKKGRPNKKRKKKSHEDARKRRQNDGLNDYGKPIEVINDEVVTPDDPKGNEKIDELGYLKGGRMFMVRTFTIPNRGERLYMVSTDAARNVGYRDSYFLFQKHKNLFRYILPEEDKPGLIESGILTSTYKTRSVYLVTARSIFKEFGARTIANGRQVIDDYYEDRARQRGAVEGAPAIVTEQYPSTSLGVYNERFKLASALASAPGGAFVAETTWIYDHALKVRQFEEMLLYDRKEVLKGKPVRDVYTGINFVPSITQPTCHKIVRIAEVDNHKSKKKLTVETRLNDNPFIKTGLKDVPLEVFDGLVDEETKAAILEQQKLETQFNEY